jgi:hypothetical protein
MERTVPAVSRSDIDVYICESIVDRVGDYGKSAKRCSQEAGGPQ